MESVSFTPKGGDGASAEDEYHIGEAIETFKSLASAITADETDLAGIIWEHFVLRVGDDVNPYAAFVQAGILTTATAVRALAGDPDPTGPPQGQLELMTVVWNRVDETTVQMEEVDVATAAINHAANWEWDKLNDLMSSTVADMPDDSFLRALGAVLMSIFVGIGGLESIERTG